MALNDELTQGEVAVAEDLPFDDREGRGVVASILLAQGAMASIGVRDKLESPLTGIGRRISAQVPMNRKERRAARKTHRSAAEATVPASAEADAFVKLLQAARQKEEIGGPSDEVIAAYLNAAAACPTRAEALHGAARFCRNKGIHEQGYQFAVKGLAIARPNNAPAIEDWIYDYGLLDELAVNAYWIGKYAECVQACDRLLSGGKLPEEKRDRVLKNKQFALDKVTERHKPKEVGASDAQNGRLQSADGRRKTIGLCMIVKNESHVIVRCLESVRPLIDYVQIEDTGSTDGTQAIIRKWLDQQGLPGEVFDEPWRDFGHNRSVALARLRERKDVDYALVIDADDLLVTEAGFDVAAFKKGLSDDEYRVEIRNGPLRYQRSQICSNRREYRYRGVLHEFLQDPPGGVSIGTAVGFHMISNRAGARNEDPDKYIKDGQILESALSTETDPSLCARYVFYIARSYHYGKKEKALDYYLKRAELGYWSDEIFHSLYSAADLLKEMGRPFDEVVAMYLRASDATPSRAEALHAASRLCRESKKYADGFEYARRGLKITLPSEGLFVQPWIYEYGLLDELAVNAYWIGTYAECAEACDQLLNEGKLPAEHRDRVSKNKNFALDKLKGSHCTGVVGGQGR